MGWWSDLHKELKGEALDGTHERLYSGPSRIREIPNQQHSSEMSEEEYDEHIVGRLQDAGYSYENGEWVKRGVVDNILYFFFDHQFE